MRRKATLITVNVHCDLKITLGRVSYRAVPEGDAVPVRVRGPDSPPPGPRLSRRPLGMWVFNASRDDDLAPIRKVTATAVMVPPMTTAMTMAAPYEDD